MAQVEASALARAVDQLWEGIADAAGTDIVDREHGVVFAQRSASVDHLLGPALDLGVAALHRIEVQRLGVAAGRHRTGRAAAHADAHARPAKLHQQRAGAKLQLVGLTCADRTQPASDHDGLVVAALNAGHRLLEDPEIARQIGSAEFVVEGRATEWAVDHDLQRAGNVVGLADRGALPGLVEPGQVQVGDRKPGQASLGTGATAGRALVTDLATGTGRCPRKRRDCGRVVVRLDLHQHMRGLLLRAVLLGAGQAVTAGLRRPALHRPTFHHRGVVAVGDDAVLRREFLGVADHAEHRQRLVDPVDAEIGIEDLVPAMLAVGLGEHHQLDIAGVAPKRGESVHQVIDFVSAQCQAELGVGANQRLAATASAQPQHIDMDQRLGGLLVEQGVRGIALVGHALGHAVVQLRTAGLQLLGAERLGAEQTRLDAEPELGHALDPVQRQAAVAGDVGGLAGPGRDGAQARHHQHQRAAEVGVGRQRVTVLQQCGQTSQIGCCARGGHHPVHVTRCHADDPAIDGLQAGQQSLGAKRRECVATLETQQRLNRIRAG